MVQYKVVRTKQNDLEYDRIDKVDSDRLLIVDRDEIIYIFISQQVVDNRREKKRIENLTNQ